MFDERIEKAIYILWVDMESKRAKKAKELLEQAANDGVADAYYFLGRIYAGPCFVNPIFKFEENDAKTEEYFNLSIENGSAIGMFAARRMAGFEPRCGSMVCEPYHSVEEVWDAVCSLADSGEIFAKYLIANAYYYGDIVGLLNLDFSSLTEAQIEARLRGWALKAIEMYEELISKGMVMGVYNYIDIITSGDYGVPINTKRAKEIEKIYKKKTSTGLAKVFSNIFS